MKLLILTNLYPPQELGGYGRSMADFAWGLKQRRHQVHVLTSDAAYLGEAATRGDADETVQRSLLLKGSYEQGVHAFRDADQCERIDQSNIRALHSAWHEQNGFDGVIVGNIDLLGTRILRELLIYKKKIIHHIGFVNPPYLPGELPSSKYYQLVGASQAVSTSLMRNGLVKKPAAVVYPGVRHDLFGQLATGRALPQPLDGRPVKEVLGTQQHPLKVCFAGLLMASKGAHTLIDALVILNRNGIYVQGHVAGGSFQPNYREQLEQITRNEGLAEILFVGQLNRKSLARFYRLHHVCVFPSIHPEAFGIVGAEAMASGLALVSSAVGGAAEVFDRGVSGLKFEADNPKDLAKQLIRLCKEPELLVQLAQNGQKRAIDCLSVTESARQLESIIKSGDI